MSIERPITQYGVDAFKLRPDSSTIGSASDGVAWTVRLGTPGLSNGWCFDVTNSAAFRVTRDIKHPDAMVSLDIYYGMSCKPTLILRENTAGTDWMQAVYDTDKKFYIEKVVSNVTTRLAGSSAVITMTDAAPDSFQFEANGSTFFVYHRGTVVFQVTDTSIPSGTRAGFAMGAGTQRVSEWQANRVELLTRVPTQIIVQRLPTMPAQSGVAHAQQPAFAVADSNGDVMASATGTMTVSLVNESGAGTTLGTLTKSIVAGVADFAGLGLGVTGLGTNHWHATNGTVSGDTPTFTVQSGVVTAEQSLVAMYLGGDARVPAFYNAATGVGATGGFVNTVDDCRGAGVGPQLVATAASGNKPIYDATAKTIEHNQSGSTNWLLSPISAGFDPSSTERTLIYCGTLESGQGVVVQLQDNASTKYVGFESGFDSGTGTQTIRSRASAGGGNVRLQPAPSTSRVLATIGVPGHGQRMTGDATIVADIAGRPILTSVQPSGSDYSSGNWRLAVGGTTSAASAPSYSHTIWRFILVLDHRPTAAEKDAILAYAATQGATIDATRKTVIYDGNSITAGQNATSINTAIPGRVLTALPGHDYSNNGVSGQTGDVLDAEQYARSLPSYHSSHPKNVYVYWGEGFNELALDLDGYTAYRHTVDACLAARARGFKVLVASVLPANITITGTRETGRLLQNSLIRANWTTFADAFADVAQITAMQNPADSSLYPDGVHPSDAGYALLANDATYGFIANISPLLSSAAPADHLAVTTQPTSPIASGAAHATQPVVAIKDSSNATVTSDTSTVTAQLVVVTGSATPIGTLTKAAVAGVADFGANGLGATSTAGATAKWRFTSGSLTLAETNVFTINAGVPQADHLAVTTQPSLTIVSGNAHSIQPVVTIQTASNATVTGDSTSVITAALIVVSGTATPLGTLTKTVTNGIADFFVNGLGAVSAAGATAKWRFTCGSLTLAETSVFTINPAPVITNIPGAPLMWIRYKATAGGAYTEVALRPNPTDVDYPDRRSYKVQTTEDGANVIQRPLRDSRVRRWIWKGYKPSIVQYQTQWDLLKTLEYRYRVENGLYPLVEIWDGETGVGGFDGRNPDTSKKYTAVKILQVQRKLRQGAQVYDESIVEFVIEDSGYSDF